MGSHHINSTRQSTKKHWSKGRQHRAKAEIKLHIERESVDTAVRVLDDPFEKI